MKEVLVPDHIAREVEAEKQKPEEDKSELDQAYVNSDDRVLDPTLLEKSYLERMPQPTGWRLLILPYKGKAVTKGGIVLAKETVERESLATVVAYVVKMGPLCYADRNKFGDTPWSQGS